ncbi:Anaphase-promoting complex subunit 10, partial [Conglomerata obtusa]
MNVRLSSFKHDFGINELLSTDMSKYWHTDDNLPHFIEISFLKRTHVEMVQLFLSFAKDDCYTPELLEVWTGLVRENMRCVKKLNVFEPEGAISLSIDEECFYIYIIIRANHQDGRDSHVRHVK